MSSISNFLKQFEEKKQEVPIGETIMNFGKHKGKTYDEIYNNDKLYVRWLVTSTDNQYIKKVKNYFLEKIEQDFNHA